MCSACLLNLMKNCSHIILTSVCVMQYFVTYLLCAHHASFMTVLCTPFGLGVIYFQDETYLHRYFTAFTETLCYCSIQVFTCVANCCCDFSKCNATKHALIQAVCSCLWVESMELCAVFVSSVYVTVCSDGEVAVTVLSSSQQSSTSRSVMRVWLPGVNAKL